MEIFKTYFGENNSVMNAGKNREIVYLIILFV